MVFNRKDYGMNKGIPFISIADHVEVNFHLKRKRVSGHFYSTSNSKADNRRFVLVGSLELT